MHNATKMDAPETPHQAGSAPPDGQPGAQAASPPERRIVVRREKTLARDMEPLQEWCSALDVVRWEAERVYREAVRAGLLRGRYAKVLLAASIYVAARQTGNPVTLRDVARATGERIRNVRRIVMLVGEKVGMPPQDVWKYIEKGAQRLNLPPGDWSLVNLDAIHAELGPPMRAGITLYVASHKFGSPRSIDEVAKATGLNTKVLRHYVGKKGVVKPKAVAG